MNIEKIEAIKSFDISKLRHVLTSSSISETQKIRFIEQNKSVIQDITKIIPTDREFVCMMQSRPLEKFKPLKNSFTKKGDKILLAKTLGIPVSEVDDYIVEISEDISLMADLKFLPEDKFQAVKTYVFRHGGKDSVVAFLDTELRRTKDKVKGLFTTLEYHSGGVADYFIRPIHRMDNKTFIKLYNVIDKHIEEWQKTGLIEEANKEKLSQYALKKLYTIKNNSTLINAIKTYKVLSK